MLPHPGSPTYIPALLGHLQAELASGGQEWGIDPSLFSTLLLAQIVGPERGGVIVDVLPSETGSTSAGLSKVVNCVEGLSRSVFGLETHHLHLDRHSHPSELPSSLFLGSSFAPHRHARAVSTSTRAGRSNTISTPSSRYASALPSPRRPRSYIGSRTTTPGVTPGITPKNSLPLLNPSLTPKDEYGFGPALVSLRAQSDQAQDGQEVLVDSPGPVDGEDAERRLPQCLIVSGLERAESAVWGKLVETLLKGHVEDGGPVGGARDPSCTGDKAEVSESRRWDLPEGFWVIWVREEEKSEKCPSWLIDQFSCSVCVHPDDLEMPLPMPKRDIIPSSYINSVTALLPYTHIHPPLSTHLSNLLSGISAHPRLSSSITGRAALLLPQFVKAHRLISAQFALPAGWEEVVQTRRDVLATSAAAAKAGLGAVRGAGGEVRVKKQDEGWVDTWGILAGEEPTLADLVLSDGDGGEWEGIDCQPGNAHAVFTLAVRHRVGWREERREVMYLLKGSAVGRTGDGVSAGDGEGKMKQRNRERRKRREVDMMLEDILAVV